MGHYLIAEQRLAKKNEDLRAAAQAIHAVRKKRDATFPDQIFSDIGWDIALLLYANDNYEEGLTEEQIIDELGKPAGTIKRYVNLMKDQGLLIQGVARLALESLALKLTDKALTFMETSLDAHRAYFIPLPDQNARRNILLTAEKD